MGKFQSRWYRTMHEEKIGGETVWNETAVTHMRLKSIIARVTKEGGAHTIFGFVLNDGTPVKSVEVKVDNGPWQAATRQTPAGEYAWEYLSYTWNGAAGGAGAVPSGPGSRPGAAWRRGRAASWPTHSSGS